MQRCFQRLSRVTTALLAASLIAAAGAGSADAQQLGLPRSAVLTISADRLFTVSAFGSRVLREIEAESALLAAENRRIESELSAEELDLTRRRPDLSAEEFRALADAFDEKVQENRRVQDSKVRELNQLQETAQAEFFEAARPILATLMREAGAGVLLERSNVFISANAVDITDIAISRIDEAIGDGAPAPDPAPDGDQ